MLKLHDLPKSTFGKLLISNLLLIFSMSLIGLLSFFTSKNIINTYIEKANSNTLNQVKKNIDMLVDQVITVVSLFDHNNMLADYLKKNNYDSFERLKNIDIVDSQINKYSFAYDWLKYETILLGVNGTVYSPDGESSLNTDTIQRYSWYHSALQNEKKISWQSTHESFIDKTKNVFTAVKTLHAPFSEHYYGLLLLSIDESCLYNIYKDSMDNESSFIIFDSSGNVISDSDRKLVGKRIDLQPFEKLLKGPINSHQIIKIGHIKYLCIYQNIEKTNWTILNTVPLTIISRDINILSFRIFIISLVLITFSIILAVIISRKIAIPLINLTHRIQSYSQKSASLADNTITDEIAVLSKEYDNIITELEETIHNLIKEHDEKRKTELHALQMQIKPHFLYNTLNSIKCLIWTGRTEFIEPTINALINLLEQTISQKEEFITLEAELRCIKDYIYIQEIRSSRTIRLNIQISKPLQDCRIPKLLLQPFIENSIFHGFEPKDQSHSGSVWGTISIYCTSIGNDIQIEVLDDGIGMDQSTVEDLLTDDSQIISRRFSGIGVKNVLERIQLYFGPQYGLRIHSEPNVGTSVIITLPQIWDNGKTEVSP